MDREKVAKKCAEWPLAECSECGMVFYKDTSWRTICVVCFKVGHDYKLLAADKQVLRFQGAIKMLSEECKKRTKEAELWKGRATRVKKEAKKLLDDGEVMVNKKLLRKLLFLCHPDKHQGSEKSKEMTQWLLSLGED